MSTSSRPGHRSLSLGTNVKVGIVEVVADIPSQHLELLPLQQNCMEPTQREEQAPILLNLLHAIVGLLRQRWNCSASVSLFSVHQASFDAVKYAQWLRHVATGFRTVGTSTASVTRCIDIATMKA